MSPRTKKQNEEIRRQTRQQILNAAFELFASEGYSKTSISAVARKAGISKGLIYHYFESKEAILEAIFDQLVEIGDEVMDFPKDFSPSDKIRQTLEKTFAFIEKNASMGRLMISLALQPDAFASIKSKVDKVQSEQLEVFSKILKEVGCEQPEVEAYQLGATLDGILLGRLSMGEDYPLEEIKQKIMEVYAQD